MAAALFLDMQTMSTFEIKYHVAVRKDEQIDEKIEGMCIEQTTELPRGVVNSDIEEKVVGKPLSAEQIAPQKHEVVISWPIANLGHDISQFLNILYGNISLQSGIRIISADWKMLSSIFEGPAAGIKEIRKQYDIPNRPLSATALKPLGSSSEELAERAYLFSKGGIDVIKDDHGLADQEYAPFEERLKTCVKAVDRAKNETGIQSYYFPNITSFAPETVKRYKQAAEQGADGVLLCPHIAGLETMHRLARLDIALPIIAHPAFSGSLTTNDNQGLSPAFLYGQLWRALGADFVIYPNKGGRFSFTSEQCRGINDAVAGNHSPFKKAFPMPGGGIKLENMSQWVNDYGKDITFLIGGSLYEHPDGIESAANEFHNKLTQAYGD